jgi:hypothetical protein
MLNMRSTLLADPAVAARSPRRRRDPRPGSPAEFGHL